MRTNVPCNCQRCFDIQARRIGLEVIDVAPADPDQKNLLRAYMEPPWIFPAMVGMVNQRWGAGRIDPKRITPLTETVEDWLERCDFFHPDTPAAVKWIFAGAVSITAYKIFSIAKNVGLN